MFKHLASLLAFASLVTTISIGCNDSQLTEGGTTVATGKDPSRTVQTDWSCTGTFTDPEADPVVSGGMNTSQIGYLTSHGWTYTTSTADHDVAMQFRNPSTNVISVKCGVLPSGTTLVFDNSDTTHFMATKGGNEGKQTYQSTTIVGIW